MNKTTYYHKMNNLLLIVGLSDCGIFLVPEGMDSIKDVGDLFGL